MQAPAAAPDTSSDPGSTNAGETQPVPSHGVSAPVTDPASYLGPAVLEHGSSPGLWARLEDGRQVEVELALAFPYEPSVDDVLLVIGQSDSYFGIGILSGAGNQRLAFPADTEIHAEGTLNLRGGEGVTVEAPQVTLRGEVLRTFAETITERSQTAFHWVKDMLTVRAGESRRTVQGEDYTQCERSVTLSEGMVKVDGHSVQLGH